MTAVVGLLGKAQAGKDTLAKYLVEDHGFVRLAFADALKAVLYDTDPQIDSWSSNDYGPLTDLVDEAGWEAAKKAGDVRGLLQRLGVAVREHVDPDAWLNAVRHQIKGGSRYVITDVRFPNEYDMVAGWPGPGRGYTVRVIRPDNPGVGSHVSETALDGYDVDACVWNDSGLHELRKATVHVAKMTEVLALPLGKLDA